jgi:hypothetical protein
MTSFVRTIRADEDPMYVQQLLARRHHWIPLKIRPKKAVEGDHIYLCFQGALVGRALISEIVPAKGPVRIGSTQRQYNAKWLVKYEGPWEAPTRRIPCTGSQGIRYLLKHPW